MDEVTNEQANRILSLIADSMEQGKEFVLEQAPDVAQQIVAFGRAYETALCVMAALCFVACLYGIRRLPGLIAEAERATYENEMSAQVKAMAVGIVSFLGGLLSATAIMTELRPCCLAWFAPKLYILEYCSRLVN